MEEMSKHDRIRNRFGLFGGLSFIFGIAASALFYKAGIGLNSFIFTIIMVILLVIASRKLGIRITRGTCLYFAAAVLLGLSNMLTSSWRLQFLNSIGILLLLEVSLIRLFRYDNAKSITEYLYHMVLVPIHALSSVWMLFSDANRFAKDKKIVKNEKLRNVLIGCVITVPILFVIIALLSSADMVFGKITRTMFERIFYSDIYVVAILTVFGTLLCYSLFCGASRESAAVISNNKKANPTIGITISSLLLIVYVTFCAIQVLYLFAGGLFTLPEEFTYSEYARQGFFELLAVTCLNIVLILVCVNVFDENKWLKGALAAVTACTYIMIASAAYRMFLYIGAYHLTFLRLFVLLFLLIDALLLAGVIISIYRRQFPLFEYSVAVISICYILFSFSKPDYYTAKYFLEHKEVITSEDITFLTSELSHDAAGVVVPFLKEHPEYENDFFVKLYYKRAVDKSGKTNIRGYNRSYERAYELIR